MNFCKSDQQITVRNQKKTRMVLQDINILIKKILVGFILVLVPLALIFGALWFTQKTLTPNTANDEANSSQIQTSLNR